MRVHLPCGVRWVLVAITLGLAAARAQAPVDLRVALVIGNGAYRHAPVLANPGNDAKAMAQSLRDLGFQVLVLQDSSRAHMVNAVDQFKALLRGKQGIGLLYYAGHGVQVDARNFMLPVEANLQRPGDVPLQSVDVSTVIAALTEAGTRMNIVVLDACRNNPFGPIASGKGLAPLDAPSGTFLAYATAPGNVAEDGDAQSANGLYTRFLLQELKRPQARIEDVFKRVRFAVRKASDGRQIPWESTSLEEDFFFNEGRVMAQDQPSAQQLLARFDQEKQDWDRIKASVRVDDFYAFVQKQPNGLIAEAAHARINQLSAPSLVVQGGLGQGSDLPYQTSKFRPGEAYRQITTVQLPTGKSIQSTLETRVSKVDADRVELTAVELGNAKAVPMVSVYDRSAGLVMTPDAVIDPPLSYVPGGLMQVGMRWTSAHQFTLSNKALFGRQRAVTLQNHIVAREPLALPAGNFNAFRIESIESKSDGSPSVRSVYWMVPDLPLPIKIERTLGQVKSTTVMTQIDRAVPH